jgi:hypothetical protein
MMFKLKIFLLILFIFSGVFLITKTSYATHTPPLYYNNISGSASNYFGYSVTSTWNSQPVPDFGLRSSMYGVYGVNGTPRQNIVISWGPTGPDPAVFSTPQPSGYYYYFYGCSAQLPLHNPTYVSGSGGSVTIYSDELFNLCGYGQQYFYFYNAARTSLQAIALWQAPENSYGYGEWGYASDHANADLGYNGWYGRTAGDLDILPSPYALTAIGFGSDEHKCRIGIKTAPVNADGTVNFSQTDASFSYTYCIGGDISGSDHPYVYWEPAPNMVMTGWSWGADDTSGGMEYPRKNDEPVDECFYQEYINLYNPSVVYRWGSAYDGDCTGYTAGPVGDESGRLQAVARAPLGRVIVAYGFGIDDDADLDNLVIVTRIIASTPTGTITASTPTCTIPLDGSSCTINFSWTTNNIPSGETVTIRDPLLTIFATGPSGSSVPLTINGPPGGRTYGLFSDATLLDFTGVANSCVSGTSWDIATSKCINPTPPGSLNVSVSAGGTVTSSDTFITCTTTISPCSRSYTAGTAVTLTATPSSSYWKFNGWSGAGCTGIGPCALTISSSFTSSVTASFVPRSINYREF